MNFATSWDLLEVVFPDGGVRGADGPCPSSPAW